MSRLFWLLGLAAFCFGSVASALPTGIATGACNGCHVPDDGVTFEGSLSLAPGSTLEPGIAAEFTLRVEEPGMKLAGYFISVNGVGELEAGQNNRLDSGGIVHSRPAAATDGVAEVKFNWTPPPDPGGAEFYVFVVAANDSSDATGDIPAAGVFSFAWGCEGLSLYEDIDGDGFGKDDGPTSLGCATRDGWAAQSGDCNDLWANINPGVSEVPGNAKDDNCDGQVDEGETLGERYLDADGDGYGAGANIGSSHTPGAVDNALDCDDENAQVSPAATEQCDLQDNDCDGIVDEDLTCSGTGSCLMEPCAAPAEAAPSSMSSGAATGTAPPLSEGDDAAPTTNDAADPSSPHAAMSALPLSTQMSEPSTPQPIHAEMSSSMATSETEIPNAEDDLTEAPPESSCRVARRSVTRSTGHFGALGVLAVLGIVAFARRHSGRRARSSEHADRYDVTR